MIVWASGWRGSKLCIRTCRFYSQRVWTKANLAKDFVKAKTYSDLIVLKQDAHDKLGEPARWVLYAVDFDKSPYPVMDKARAEQ
jgi:hypothetical protein